jgi:hypothetical protein
MSEAYEARYANYICSAVALSILVVRIAVSRWYRKPIDASVSLAVVSIIIIAARAVANHVYLTYGTANDASSNPNWFDVSNEASIKIGSVMVLLSRSLLTVALWLQVAILLLFYSRITSGITVVSRLIASTWAVWTVTLVAIILATFLECQPFDVYWSVTVGPQQCRRAYVQLLLQGISNMILDLMVLVMAYPLVTLRNRTWSERISLYTLFGLGIFCIVTTIIRVVLIFQNGSSQTTRSLWAAVQLIVSTFVANAPTIYGLLRSARRNSPHERGTPVRAAGKDSGRLSKPETKAWTKMAEEEGVTSKHNSTSPNCDLTIAISIKSERVHFSDISPLVARGGPRHISVPWLHDMVTVDQETSTRSASLPSAYLRTEETTSRAV